MNKNRAILATLAYHDIFDYPLTEEEIHKYLIQNKSSITEIEKALRVLTAKNEISRKDKYYFLPGRLNIAALRQKREMFSKNKLRLATFYSYILWIIPTVKLVAITGALSMENCQNNDDIDLLIVTSSNMLWTTRLLCNLILLPFKRSPNSKKTSNRACLNIFLDETDLKTKTQNLYIAHEVCQVRLLWDRSNTYSRFLYSNKWTNQFLPNFKYKSSFTRKGIKKATANELEKILKKLQLKYMRSKITTEEVGERQLFFHPNDTQNKIMDAYSGKLKKLT